MNKVLVVSPHPDDETLGAGGSLLKFKNKGDKIYWLNITNMKTEYGYNDEQIEKRKLEIEKVVKFYGFNGVFDLELCPTKLEEYKSNEIISKISRVISDVQPNIIILPNRNDAHSDHKKVFDWCYSCTKVFRYPYIKKILTMEILSETDFSSNGDLDCNYFIDITKYIEEKIKIFEIYKSEIGEHPFPRSIEGIKSLATLRGIRTGVKYAEAFRAIKIIE